LCVLRGNWRFEIGYIAEAKSFVRVKTKKHTYIISTNNPQAYLDWFKNSAA
jgi:hypothetical protein